MSDEAISVALSEDQEVAHSWPLTVLISLELVLLASSVDLSS